MPIYSPQIIQLPRVNDIRGNLSFFESENQLPFDIKRVHWIYDVPGGETRGGVAYKTTEEFIVAMSGSFDVKVHDGEREYKFSLNRSYMGVYIPKGVWPRDEYAIMKSWPSRYWQMKLIQYPEVSQVLLLFLSPAYRIVRSVKHLVKRKS